MHGFTYPHCCETVVFLAIDIRSSFLPLPINVVFLTCFYSMNSHPTTTVNLYSYSVAFRRNLGMFSAEFSGLLSSILAKFY